MGFVHHPRKSQAAVKPLTSHPPNKILSWGLKVQISGCHDILFHSGLMVFVCFGAIKYINDSFSTRVPDSSAAFKNKVFDSVMEAHMAHDALLWSDFIVVFMLI
jgi:hypothetical protein